MPNEKSGPFDGDLAFDAAHDELSATVEFLVSRIDSQANAPEFDSIDLPSMRANVAILLALINQFGGGHQATAEKIREWEKAVDRVFTEPERWGYQAWPEELKKRWQNACQETIADLRKAIRAAYS
jgi:hypothetical protein